MHGVVQLPQWATSESEASQPSALTWLQSAQPGAHSKEHPPLRQVELVVWSAALDAGGHTTPQRPQFAGSPSRLTSQPLEALPSQSA